MQNKTIVCVSVRVTAVLNITCPSNKANLFYKQRLLKSSFTERDSCNITAAEQFVLQFSALCLVCFNSMNSHVFSRQLKLWGQMVFGN